MVSKAKLYWYTVLGKLFSYSIDQKSIQSQSIVQNRFKSEKYQKSNQESVKKCLNFFFICGVTRVHNLEGVFFS